jgi:DNA-binding transcriptional MerR regulator
MTSQSSRRRGAAPPEIPDKLYFRIGEVARLCSVEAYVLRFWESEFPQLRPNKSGTGQRLYRKRDVETAMRIKRLLHDEGYTIAGARQVFHSEVRKKPEVEAVPAIAPSASTTPALTKSDARVEARLQKLRGEVKDLLNILSGPPGNPTASGPRPQLERKKKRPSQDGPNLFEP